MRNTATWTFPAISAASHVQEMWTFLHWKQNNEKTGFFFPLYLKKDPVADVNDLRHFYHCN